MADAFTQLGISRRPADVLFGRPDLSGGTAAGWSSVAVAQDEADRAARDEEQARADARAAATRNREAEVAADQFVRTDPSAREKFLGANPALVGSKRFNEIVQYQKMQPSYADTRLANSVAMKIADPDARQVFHTAVQNGAGTLAAKDEADRFIAKRAGMAKLTAAGIHPTEANRIVDEEGYSPDIINHHVYKAKGETVFHRDPEAQALEKYYHTLKDRAAIEAKDPLNISGGPSPETAAEMRRVGELLGGLYKSKSPLASKTPAAPAGAGTVLAPPPVAAPAGAPLKDTLRSMTPTASTASVPKPEGLPLASDEEVQQAQRAEINNPENDENYYSTLIANPSVSLATKTEALAKLREYVANPKPDSALTLPQVFARREELKKKLNEAEEEVKFHPEREQFIRAWDTSKKEVDSMVDKLAARLGVPKQSVINSMMAGDKLEIPGRENDRGGISIPQLLAEEWAADHPQPAGFHPHQLWSTEAPALVPFKSSPFASRLGTKVGPVPLRQTRGDVLDAYLKDQVSAAPAARPTASAAPLKIKSITPLN